MSAFDFILLVLATYYLSWALVRGAIFHWLHNRTSLWGMLDCVYCTGFWVALACWLVWTFVTPVPIMIVAIAGGAKFLDQFATIILNLQGEIEHTHE